MSRIAEMGHRPFIVGLGGTSRENSTSEKAVRIALEHAQSAGAEIKMLTGPDLLMPIFDPLRRERSEQERSFVETLRRSDGIILSSPGYHGAVSGLIKNALDYTEDMSRDSKAYFGARAVGLIGVAAGWQAANSTLVGLRSIVHALRGWPTPMGITINSTEKNLFDDAGRCLDPSLDQKLRYMARQVVVFAVMRFTARAAYPDWELWPQTDEYFPKLRLELSS
jgi:FMN reductase